jgi:hypothetical protein
MNYRFEQFNVEITDPIIQVVCVADNINTKTCGVDIKLTTDTAEFGVNLQGFTYEETWEDSDIRSWVASELVNYEV